MAKKDESFEKEASASSPDYSPERNKIVDEHAKSGGDPTSRITEPVAEVYVGRGAAEDATKEEDAKAPRMSRDRFKKSLPEGPVGDDMPGTASGVTNMNEKIKSEETALPKDQADPKAPHDVLHTPDGEMPDSSKNPVGKDALTEEDEKKAS